MTAQKKPMLHRLMIGITAGLIVAAILIASYEYKKATQPDTTLHIAKCEAIDAPDSRGIAWRCR